MKIDPTHIGEADLLEQVYGRDPKVLKFIHYRLGVQEAEDLTGEVFLKLIRSTDRQVGRFEPWLFKLARNTIIDRVRYRDVRK